MIFASPWFLLLLPVVLVLAWWEFKKRTGTIAYPDLSFFKIAAGPIRYLRRLPMILAVIGLGLIVLALARPQQGRVFEDVEANGIDIMLCLDISQTMSLRDYSPLNRLNVAKAKAKEFIEKRPGDRIGMVVFAQDALTQCPLTLDKRILADLIDRINFGIVPWVQTAIGSGLAMSVARLKGSQAKDRIVILLTDGQNNTGDVDPITAAKLAQAYGIKVYCIGVGTKGQAGMSEQSGLDMKTLDRIASLTGGQAFLATDAEALKTIYDEINQMEPTTFKVQRHTVYSERTGTFLTPGAMLMALSALLGMTILRRLP